MRTLRAGFFACFIGFALQCNAGDIQWIPESVPLALKSGRVIQANVLRPEIVPAKNKKLSAILIFGGFERAGEVLGLVHPEEAVLLASFDYPFDPPRKFEFPGSLGVASEVKRMVHETIEGIGKLIEALKRRSDVDSGRIVIVGASLGAPFGVVAASRFEDLRGLVVVQGFGKIPRTALHQLMMHWGPEYGPLAYPVAWMLSYLGWRYLEFQSPEDAARTLRPGQEVLLLDAKEDSFIPLECRESLREALRQSKASIEQMTLPGGHLHPGADAEIDAMMQVITKWLHRVGLLL